MEENMVKCPNCGSINSSRRTECVYCHAKLDHIVIQTPPTQRASYFDAAPEIKQPVVVNNYIASSPNSTPHSHFLMSLLKSQGVQFLLSFFFGIFGLLYASVSAFFIGLAIEACVFITAFFIMIQGIDESAVENDLLIELLSFGLIAGTMLFDRLIAIVGGIFAVRSFNKKIYLELGRA